MLRYITAPFAESTVVLDYFYGLYLHDFLVIAIIR